LLSLAIIQPKITIYIIMILYTTFLKHLYNIRVCRNFFYYLKKERRKKKEKSLGLPTWYLLLGLVDKYIPTVIACGPLMDDPTKLLRSDWGPLSNVHGTIYYICFQSSPFVVRSLYTHLFKNQEASGPPRTFLSVANLPTTRPHPSHPCNLRIFIRKSYD
jgi:hypothetical protein